MADVKPYVYIYIYNLEHNYICISLLYVYIHTYMIIYIRENMEQCIYKYAKNWIHIKKRNWGDWGRMQPPPKKVEYGTQGVYTGQHASCDHMERMLRQNRDSHGKRGETQIK